MNKILIYGDNITLTTETNKALADAAASIENKYEELGDIVEIQIFGFYIDGGTSTGTQEQEQQRGTILIYGFSKEPNDECTSIISKESSQLYKAFNQDNNKVSIIIDGFHGN